MSVEAFGGFSLSGAGRTGYNCVPTIRLIKEPISSRPRIVP